MSYIRCAICRGQKKVVGLGCMIKKCVACNATGYVKQDTTEELMQDADVKDDATEKKAVKEIAKTESTQTKRKSHWSKKDAS